MRAEILSYSRARGVFAGVSLEGSTLRPDNEANHKLYGQSTDAEKIIDGQGVAVPPAAHDLVATLKKASAQLSH
jgi:lipid-binding SYLF domain-containing protein